MFSAYFVGFLCKISDLAVIRFLHFSNSVSHSELIFCSNLCSSLCVGISFHLISVKYHCHFLSIRSVSSCNPRVWCVERNPEWFFLIFRIQCCSAYLIAYVFVFSDFDIFHVYFEKIVSKLYVEYIVHISIKWTIVYWLVWR